MHSLDLNLLTALDALLEEGSVLGAAQRLRLSPPAMSRTLGRIRRATGDAILVRTGRTMTATPYALRVQADVHRVVREAQSLLAPDAEVVPATLERTFTLRFHDGITAAVGPALLRAVCAEAPGVRLRFLGESGADTSDLRHGRVDFEMGADEPQRPEIRWEVLGHDERVLAIPARWAGKTLSRKRFGAVPHIIVSRRGRLRDPLDDVVQRRTVASAPTVEAALGLAAAIGAVVAVPARMTADAVARHGMRVVPLPVEAPPVPIILRWHQRNDTDRAHAWLRQLIAARTAP
ncbi:LysR family transcriptional regulator [Dactylosporangium matsuzakiense]|uniref:LysR family transcriptional regulator n=1 Tax=Dactylosporangium matsuzakiense TaxID=53360 RepID=A0A9W6NPL2_9ACTN|nr:LysR family transcriptional regulator [Dactylosporangium matsuzakiense]UWZ47447.1 LysR family transcriptional regulator [Dactylosporangium matsuzakiense]GLL05200.1 LysR family transcriptional regulator [Dactylosporangium matsuzakiense]